MILISKYELGTIHTSSVFRKSLCRISRISSVVIWYNSGIQSSEPFCGKGYNVIFSFLNTYRSFQIIHSWIRFGSLSSSRNLPHAHMFFSLLPQIFNYILLLFLLVITHKLFCWFICLFFSWSIWLIIFTVLLMSPILASFFSCFSIVLHFTLIIIIFFCLLGIEKNLKELNSDALLTGI